ncbi:MAG TPA: SDR family NAD(P)-dependent oxidoreductase [Anaerolineales bacterium]|jgi:NAD(P)-dependent dehydrogenase (short-subunit alcohol dehydrogenase family)|nr:SDR family NAD(P)-dependent oxidoreductase [Anaerolineales bacterium]
MPNKVIVLTDATSGIGKALAVGLAKTGESVVIVAHDAEHGKLMMEEVRLAAPDANVDLQLSDLSILSSVRNLAEILKSKYPAIDVLINNASVHKRTRTVTIDGFEEMFAANYLGPFLLTNLLLDPIQAAAQANGFARILNITAPSDTPLNFDDLQSERDFKASNTFNAARTAILLFTLELARQLESSGITVNAIHSESMNEGFFLTRLFTRSSPENAAASIVQAAVAPEFGNMTGKFLDEGNEVEVPAYTRDQDVQRRLWEISERLSGLAATKGITPINDPHLEQ